MNQSTPSATNARQIKHAARKFVDRRDRELSDLRALLSEPYGRRIVWRLLGHCGLYATPSAATNETTRENIGRGDVARFLLAEVMEADPNGWLKLQVEAQHEAEADAREADTIRKQSTGDEP